MKVRLTAPQSKIFRDESRFLQAVCGRRFGKSYLAAAKLAYEAISKTKQELLYAAPSFGMAKEVFCPLFINMVPQSYIRQWHKTDHFFLLRNGSTVSYKGSTNYDAFRGVGRNGVVVDESSDIPFAALEEAIMPSLSDKEGWLWAIGTPEGQANWFYDITLQDDWKTYHYTTLDGGNVRVEEVERMRRKMDPRTFRQEYLASFEDLTSKVYYCYDETSVDNSELFEAQSDTYLAWDFNYNPMTCIIVQKRNNKYYAVKEFVHRKSNTQSTAESVVEYFEKMHFAGNLFITGDSAGSRHESTASHTDWEIIQSIFRNFRGYQGIEIRRTKKN